MAAATHEVRRFTTSYDEVAWIEHLIGVNFADRDELDVLEAGCGRAWYLNLDRFKLHITGVDINDEALTYRTKIVQDLEDAVCGDLGTVHLADDSFDLTYCAYVLEHVAGTRGVFENLGRWTRPDGLLVIRLPDRDTIFGLAARRTPYRSHVWFYRYVLRQPLAGTEGRAPFPTVYEEDIARPAIRAMFTNAGFEIVGECVTVPFPGRHTRLWRTVRALLRLAGAVTLGRLSGRHNNFTIIVRKCAALQPQTRSAS